MNNIVIVNAYLCFTGVLTFLKLTGKVI